MHYFTHHGDFAKGTFLDNIRRAHVGHHFIDPNKSKCLKTGYFMIFLSIWDFFTILGRTLWNKKKSRNRLNCLKNTKCLVRQDSIRENVFKSFKFSLTPENNLRMLSNLIEIVTDLTKFDRLCI